MTQIETGRLILRNVAEKDARVMHEYRNNAVCAKYQRGQAKDLESIRGLIERRRNDIVSADAPFMLAAALRESDEMIGEIVVMPKNGTFTMGYTFHYGYHRRGYAYEALTALLELLHKTYPQWDFVSFTDPENVPSMGLLKKLGYRDMGYLPDLESQVFGKWTTPATEAAFMQASREEKETRT